MLDIGQHLLADRWRRNEVKKQKNDEGKKEEMVTVSQKLGIVFGRLGGEEMAGRCRRWLREEKRRSWLGDRADR